MNPDEQINPAEQVEKIREILVGRDIELVNGRIQQLEAAVQDKTNEVTQKISAQLRHADQQNKSSQQNIESITTHIRQQLQQESVTRGQQINDLAKKIEDAVAHMDITTQQLLNVETSYNLDISQQIEDLSSEMASRIDAHSRQIMEHMHREIQQWKNRMDGQISTLTEKKVDRQELSSRLARIASAAMGDSASPSPISPPATEPTTPAPNTPFSTPTQPISSIPYEQAPQSAPNLSSLDAFALPSEDFTT